MSELAHGILSLFKDMEIDEGRCPNCGSDEIGFDTQCQEDDHQEQIEHFAFCLSCGWSEI